MICSDELRGGPEEVGFSIQFFLILKAGLGKVMILL